MEVLHQSAMHHVSIIGRRGSLQVAFTTKELRELTSLTGTSMIPLSPELVVPPPAGTKLSRQQSCVLQLLQQSCFTATHTWPPAALTKSVTRVFPLSDGPRGRWRSSGGFARAHYAGRALTRFSSSRIASTLLKSAAPANGLQRDLTSAPAITLAHTPIDIA
jgi:hypothetical protein